jgi:N-dimethylarginine dimethylaminohydrolase
MTPFGAVISRMAAQIRAGEEFDALRFISDRRIPIVAQVLGEGVFEGPDLMFLRPDLALCATSIRSNLKGVRQVTRSLEELGVEVIQIQSTYGCGHLDGVANVIARDKVLVIPRMISLTAVAAFQTCGYEIIELSDMDEIAKMAVNVLAVDDGVVLIPSDCVRTIRLLEAKRVECIPVEVSELRKGGGSIHCMTGVLRRAVGR